MTSERRAAGGGTRWLAAGLAVLLVAAATAAPAGACAVCFGDSDSAMTAGMNNAILFLLAVVALVQVGFVALFVSIRRRIRRQERRRARFHLIEGGVQ